MSKLFFLGIDSATWDLILPWVIQNKLPGFKLLLDKSDSYYCQSTFPPYTPSAWTTMFTGLTPANHGIYDFRYITPQKDIDITSTNHLIKKYVWHHLSKQNQKVCIYNIPMTYPPHPVNGIMVSSFTNPSVTSEFTYPKEIRSQLLKKFPNYQVIAKGKFKPGKTTNNHLYFNSIKKSLQQKIKVSKWLFKQSNWDVFISNFLDIDHAQHFFWSDMIKPESPFYNSILSLYQVIDNYLLEVINQYNKTHTIIVASDHGAGPSYQTIYMNHWLESRGYLKFKSHPLVQLKKLLRGNLLNPQFLTILSETFKLTKSVQKRNQDNQNKLVRRVFLDINDVDFSKTQAYSFGEYGGIYLNHSSCKHTSSNKSNKKLIKQIIHQLKADLKSRLTFIDSSTNIYQSKSLSPSIPDIQYLIDDGATTSSSVYAFHSHQSFGPPISHKSSNHKLYGMLSVCHPKAAGKLSTCTVYDLTPTILSLMKIKPPPKLPGRNLLSKPNINSSFTI